MPCTVPNDPEKAAVPVLVITDDGRDVDDIEALACLAGDPQVEIVGLVTSHMIPDRRAVIARQVMNHLGVLDVPIGVGSIHPLGKEDPMLTEYLRKHTIATADGRRTYEGEGIIETFPSAEDVVIDAVRKYGKDLRILVQAPLTDLAKAIQLHPAEMSGVGGIYIQGQATDEDGRLVPDMAAYNLSEDPEAANIVFGLQDTVPFTLIGKHAAYTVPLFRDDFDEFAATGNKVGSYLRTHAIAGIKSFAERSPEIFRRVFGVDPSELETLTELSKPYDALVAVSVSHLGLFEPDRVGHHTLIGMTPERSGVTSPFRLKEYIMQTILRALNVSQPDQQSS